MARTIRSGLASGLLLYAVLLAFAAGFRLPSLWSVNYYLPSFADGFRRRALLGTLLLPFGDLRFDYRFIAAIQMLVLAALLALILVAALRGDVRGKLLIALFFLCPAGGYLFHEVGYADQILYLILVIALLQPNRQVALALMAASVFVHEVAIFSTIPLFLAVQFHRERDFAGTARTAAGLAAATACSLLLFRLQDPSSTALFLETIAEKANYRPRVDYYVSVFAGGGPRGYWDFGPRGNLRELVMTLLLGVAAALAFAAGAARREAFLLGIAGFAATAAPLALGYLAWDVDRWIFLSICNGTACLYLAAKRTAAYDVLILVLFLMLIATTSLRYFDGYGRRDTDPRNLARFFESGLRREVARMPER